MFKKKLLILLALMALVACDTSSPLEAPLWIPYDESELLEANANHESTRLQYKLIQSKISDRNNLIQVIYSQLEGFSEEKYQDLHPLIFDQTIQSIQKEISDGAFTYKDLSQWYLYRVAKYESDKALALNAMISINPDLVKEAERLDANASSQNHPIYGMPIIVKDNINTNSMPTTAGAVALINNHTDADAEIITNLKSHGGLVLGKANLSEWANYLCAGCPNGYSAVGGQTLNPYGAREFDTGGSSSGSAVAVAANYAIAAIGSETSGSILSPSSQQSVVGLKPTVGILSQDGIVPISSTLDTPGPISKHLDDNSILFSAMAFSKKQSNVASVPWELEQQVNLDGVRFGAIASYKQDSLYLSALEELKKLGAEIIEINPDQMNFEGFSDLLGGDMKIDLKNYLNIYASENVEVGSAEDVIRFNLKDSTLRIPYGQARFEGIKALKLSEDELLKIRTKILQSGIDYFEKPMLFHNLDAILSINNYNAGQAAAAKYPGLTVPMGYTPEGMPKGLTFISRPYSEPKLYSYAKLYEEASQKRISPKLYIH